VVLVDPVRRILVLGSGAEVRSAAVPLRQRPRLRLFDSEGRRAGKANGLHIAPQPSFV
jgi:predicted NAD/FAD-binding protein